MLMDQEQGRKGSHENDFGQIESSAMVSEVKRETWTGKLDFILALIGFSVGLGNIWRFPYLCYKNGGGCFLIPYVICLVVAAMPVLTLEISLGQFMNEGGITAWSICPLFRGIGYTGVLIMQYINIYYNVVLAWSLFYLFASFTSVLPWSHCNNPWNTDQCVDVQGVGRLPTGNSTNVTDALNLTRVSSSQEFWERKVLQLSSGVDEPGTLNWDLTLCLLLAWIIVYLCVCKGVKSSGKVVYFTATFPYVLLVILFFRAVTLPGAIEGIKFYLNPDFSRLTDGQVWLDAATQVFFSYSLGMGTMIALGSYNKYKTNCYRDCITFTCVNSGTSVFGGFVIFSILGFMAGKQGVAVEDVAESGPGLAFIAYPAAVTQLPIAPLWAILFFFMLLLLGLDSEFVGVEGFVTAIADLYPTHIRVGYRKEILIAVMSVVWFFLGLCMVSKGGMYVFQIFDYYSAASFALLWATFFESVVIGWLYGGDRFYDNLASMIGFRINPWLKICWKYITPLFCMGTFLFSLATYRPLTYNKTYHYPVWAHVIGWLMALSSMLCIPIFAAIEWIKTDGTFHERWVKLTTPILPKRAGGVEMKVPEEDEIPKNNPVHIYLSNV